MFQRVTGTTDFYPEEKLTQKRIFDNLRNTALRYNYQEIEFPTLEYLDALTQKQGDEIKQQIFVLEKRGSEECGLRFEGTVSAVRMFVAKQRELKRPTKWFYIDKNWRYERPQKGRLREFYQFGVEVFGSERPEADAEIINLAVDSLLSNGLKYSDLKVLVNNRYLIQELLSFTGSKYDQVLALIDKRKKIRTEEFEKELKNIEVDARKVTKIIDCRSVEDIEKLCTTEKAKKEFAIIKKVITLLPRECSAIDLTIVRGLSYYTGIVFEIFDKNFKYRALAGGGRYDNSIENSGGEKCPATGFGMGFSTLTLLLEEKGLMPNSKQELDYYVIAVDDSTRDKAFEICEKLRKKASAEIELTGKSMGKQLEMANYFKARRMVFVGPEELKTNTVKIKDTKTGKEDRVKTNEL